MAEDIHLRDAVSASETPFTTEGLAQVFFLSYRYSQGSQELQEAIFRYIHAIHPEWKIQIEEERDEFTDRVYEIAIDKIDKFLEPSFAAAEDPGSTHAYTHSLEQFEGTPINRGESHDEAINQLITFIETLHTGVSFYPPVADVAAIMIERDYELLTRKDGRPRRFTRNEMANSPVNDPWNSHFIHWGLLGNDSGLPEFNRMFQDVTSFVMHPPKNSRSVDYDKLQEVRRIYAEKHPRVEVPEIITPS